VTGRRLDAVLRRRTNVLYAAVDVETEEHAVIRPLARRELVCALCGYGIVVARVPDRCPMCGSEQWDFSAWRPFRDRGIDAVRGTERIA
jgi:rubrerythrin